MSNNLSTIYSKIITKDSIHFPQRLRPHFTQRYEIKNNNLKS